MKNRDNFGENGYPGVFGVAVYESLITFKIQNSSHRNEKPR